MRFGCIKKFMKSTLMVGLAFNLLAFTSPQQSDLVEIKGFLYGRSSGSFTANSSNKLYVLKPGTRALVKEVKRFESGNYGLCLSLVNATDIASDTKCIWAYFHRNNPAMTLFSVSQNQESKNEILSDWAKDSKKVTLKRETTPEKAAAAQVTRTTTGVVEKEEPNPAADTQAHYREKNKVDTQAIANSAVTGITKFNNEIGRVMDQKPPAPCVDCRRPTLRGAATCNSKNDYLENSLAAMLNQSAYAAFYNSPQREIIQTACIQTNMEQFVPAASFYRLCGPQQPSGGRPVTKPCLSENYINVTAKSFNLAADCLGGYVVGDPNASLESKGQAALSIFAFMAQESGMHVNARSATGAGGPGQMTGGAIQAVNQDLRNIRAHLARSNNPNCSQLLNKALKTPLSPRAGSCDRLSLHKDNPIKSMAYAFAYQAVNRRVLSEVIFAKAVFGSILSSNLSATEVDRLMMELSAWSHNTGPAGMKRPLSVLLGAWAQNKKKIQSAADVDRFLFELKNYMARFPHPSNARRNRILETSNYYGKIQTKMKMIREAGTCLGNQ